MSTVDQIADRVYRDWLNSPEDQPVIIQLSGALTAAATTVAYDATALAADEDELIAPGVLIEIDAELARITAVGDGSVTVTRGVNGTTAAAHAAGTDIVLAPVFARSAVIEAVKDNVVQLHPSLWKKGSISLTAASGMVEVPAEVISAVRFTDTRGRLRNVTLHDPYPGVASGKAIRFDGISSGTVGFLTYRGKFARPLSADAELLNYGVREEWERIVVVGAAAQVVASRDLDTLTAEYITEQLQREALPTSAPQQIRNGLLALHGAWISSAQSSLRSEDPVTVVMSY